MATKTRKRTKKSKTSALVLRQPKPETTPQNIFWPDRIDHVKAIAARGLDDTEMAVMLGVSPALFDSWRKFYPEFNRAVEDGRALPDQEVIAALHKNAVGYEREQDVVVKTRRGAQIVTTKVFYPGETAAQRYWLNNRVPKYWRDRQEHAIGGQGKENPVHIKSESKTEIINSLLNMIVPRPDSG